MIDADGGSVIPLLVDTAVNARPEDQRDVYELAPGNPATFAVTRDGVSGSGNPAPLMLQPQSLIAIVMSRHVEARQGEPTRPPGLPAGSDAQQKWHGVWVEDSQPLEQHLLPGGRYTETRNGQTDAYTGRYWVRDNRIIYLDDTGFWAYGELVDGVLHHAGFVMHKRQ